MGMKMKIISTMAARPITWLTVLGVLALFLPTFTLSYWCIFNKNTEHKIYMNQHQTHLKMVNDFRDTIKFFSTNDSSIGLARLLNATLVNKQLSFSLLQTKVAPVLFHALSTIPNLAQISFLGINGVFLSFSDSGNGTTALYSNNTSKWYTRSVSAAGELIGDPRIIVPPPVGLNSTILLKVLNGTGYASVGARWSGGSELLFLNTVSADSSIGVISLGFPMKMISNFLASRDLQGGGLYLATIDGVVVADFGSIRNVELNGNRSFPFGGLSCKSVDKITPDSDLPSVVEFSGNKYELYCSTISLAGVRSVYTLAFPSHGLIGAIHKSNRRVMILLIMTVIVVAAFVASFMSLAVKFTREKMRLNAQLIKQMESTQQAEKKTISKSMAIATASHDIRASLSAIIGLIELCYHDVTPGSELKESLNQMSSCASDLVALLNSILDTSKIEAGKMQLHETEFNTAQLLEDLADLYHPVGMKKGVDVVLDPCDGSVYTFSNVRGDYGKLKQILSNLLSNAVKFTKEGHVSVRAWARKFIFENSVMEYSNAKTTFSCSTCFFPGQVQHVDADLQDLTRLIKTNPNCIEFVFEVDDTGVGIPKEKRRTVFENYEQVKEAVAEVGGTGLGLGIVRSLVQLMGGDIEIMDKSSYKGTCFRFNIFLVACDNGMKTFPIPNIATLPGHYHNICNDTIGSSRRAIAPPPGTDNTDSSLVVLLIQNKGRRKMIQKFLETRGLGVMVAKEAKFLPSILKKVKHKLIGSSFHSSSDLSPRLCFSSSSSTRREDTKSVPLTTLDGSYETPSILQGRANLSGISCVMLIIDANVGEFSDLSRIISDFKKDIDRSKSCKVVWLEKPETRNLHFQRNNEKTVASSDEIFIKPLHGSRLFQVIGNLPEFGGQLTEASPKWKRNNTMEVGSALDPDGIGQKLKSKVSLVSVRTYQGEIEEIGNSSSGRSSAGQKKSIALLAASKGLTGNRLTADDSDTRKERSAASKQIETALIVQTNMSSASSTSSQNPLHGKKILIADDDKVQKRIATMTLSKMGAALVETCNNGKEALELVCKSLRDQALQGSVEPPYHCILMDCQMPEMDGFEATRRIRIEEAKYDIRIPIFALTAHGTGEISDKMFEAGMDAHLERPLRLHQLVEAMGSLN